MVAPSKKSKVRRQKAKQLRVEGGGSWWSRAAAAVAWWPVVGTVVFFVAATLIALYGEESLQYSIGQKIDQPIVARVTFDVVDRAQTQKNKEAARANTPSYYRVDQKFIERICAEFNELYQSGKREETFEGFQAAAGKANWPVDEAAYKLLHGMTDEAAADTYKRWVDALRRNLETEYTAKPTSEKDRTPLDKTTYIMVISGLPQSESAAAGAAEPGAEGEPFKVDKTNLVDLSNEKNIAGRAGLLARVFDYPMRSTAEKLLQRLLKDQPILVYDQKRTLEMMSRAEESVPPATVTYEKGKPFVFPRVAEPDFAAGLGPEDLNLLKLEQMRFREFLATDDPAAAELRKERYLAGAGTAAVFALISVALFGYVGFYRPRILKVRTRTLGFGVLLLGMLLAARLMAMRPTLSHLLPVPVLVAVSILALAYDRRFALGTMTIGTLLTVLTVRGDVGLFATLLGGVSVMAIMLEDVRTRTQMITAGLVAAAVMFATSFAFALTGGQELRFSAVEAAWAALSAALAAMVMQILLPFVERAFQIVTSMTLLELRDANRPLLQRLVREAPGTYNHSLVLGTMAQSACEAIGANGLLAQVGALYHDIGKIHQAEYFAENQEASINRHDRLEPRMSLLVILSHVKNGVALATEYGLPTILHQFIEEHHGTTVVKYFLHMASEKQPKIASGKHDRAVAESEFRYEGPKPRSKETAILMLCDGAEGTVRALSEPTAGRIESVVHAVLMDRLQDGQFDDCDITLKELYQVEESLVKSLCRFYHGRVAYPKAGGKPTAERSAGEEEASQSPSVAAG